VVPLSAVVVSVFSNIRFFVVMMADDPVLPSSGEKRKRSDEEPVARNYFLERHLVDTRNAQGFQWFGFENGNYICKLCRSIINPERVAPSYLTTHQGTQKHKTNSKTMTIAEGFSNQERNQTFQEDVAALVLSNNIPFARMDNLFPREFISAVVARKEPALLSSSSYRKTYAMPSFLRWRETLIVSHLTGVPYSLIVDESTKGNRKVVNSIAVTATQTVLVDTRVFSGDESVTRFVIRDYIVNMMKECHLDPARLIGITRDNASYMEKAVDILKQVEGYGHIVGVGCLSHGLSLVINRLLDRFQPLREHLFQALKKSFSKPSAMRTRAAKKLPGFVNAVKFLQLDGETGYMQFHLYFATWK
tara:strand:+ start:458 stop:1540 length:1083 start_codon:yes stop_codon:yes gene_type:complete